MPPSRARSERDSVSSPLLFICPHALTISAAVDILEKNESCRVNRPGALCRWIAFTHGRALFYVCRAYLHVPYDFSFLAFHAPYGIVKAIRTSSPPRRVSIGAVAVAADEPLPSPLTLDVLFACLPCAISHKHKKKCCCTKFSLRSAASLSHQQFHIVLVQKSLTMQCFCVSTGCLTPPR